MLSGRVAFVDVETTGADPRHDDITEVGVVLTDDGTIVEEWSTLIQPGREIPPGIEALTGITNTMVAGAPTFAEVSLDLAARLDARLLVAHNARFDHAFLRRAFAAAGLAYQADVLCTVRLSRHLFPHERRHNLDALMARFALSCEARHRALPDARILVDLAREMAAHVGPELFGAAVAAMTRSPHRLTGPNSAGLDELPDAPGVYQLYDPAGATLFVGRATNLRTQVLAHACDAGERGRELRTALHSGAVEWTVTAGPLGTALRQLQLIESLAPRRNRPPRARDEAWALHWPPGASAVATIDLNAEEAPTDELFGPFRSRRDALGALRGLVREFELCPQAVGLEEGAGACSARVSGSCRGVCTGEEARPAHMLRMMAALSRLRLPPWPFPGAIAIIEEDPARTRRELHVAQAWRYLGSVRTEADVEDLVCGRTRVPPVNVDIFRVLLRALAPRPQHPILRIDRGRDTAP